MIKKGQYLISKNYLVKVWNSIVFGSSVSSNDFINKAGYVLKYLFVFEFAEIKSVLIVSHFSGSFVVES